MKSAFKGFGGTVFLLRHDIPVEVEREGESHFAIIQGFVTQSNSFNSKDSALYTNFHQAAHGALTVHFRTYDASQKAMLSPN
jgi:hypothetical protein